jgi:hypothetical protein
MKLNSITTAALLSGLCASAMGCGSALAAQAGVAAGAAFTLSPSASRFDIGANARVETNGPYQRHIGDKGVFMVDKVTGATLAVPTSPTIAKPPVGQRSEASTPPLALPQPLSTDPVKHSAVAAQYLTKAGVPAKEIGGTHVTTTMAGGGPIAAGVQPGKSKLLFYTTHLERKLNGVPVENSYAFAAFDKDGKVITQGSFWPAIPASVVRQALALKAKLAKPSQRSGFLAAAQDASFGGEVKDAGEVRIVHTGFDHHGQFEAKAVVTTTAKSAFGGKAQVIRLDENQGKVKLADETTASTEAVDSPKVK